MKPNIICPECGLELYYNYPADNWFHVESESMWCKRIVGRLRVKPVIRDVDHKSGGLTIECDRCQSNLSELGAIVLGPPNLDGRVTKLHVCIDCYDHLLETFFGV